MKTQSQKISSMLILSNHQGSFETLKKILEFYFPCKKENYLFLSNKYYSTNIAIKLQPWPALTSFPKNALQNEQQGDMNNEHKQDLLVMLVRQEQSFASQLYDLVIHRYNPQNFILIVDMADRQKKWKDEDKIQSEVNNFIEIVKENLDEMKKNPPSRVKPGLLTDNYEDGNIFNLFQLMETTQWSQIDKQIPQDKLIKKEKCQKQQQVEKGPDLEKEELIEQQLQQQLNNFQSLMAGIMHIKEMGSQPQKHGQRKKKAETIIHQLMAGIPKFDDI